MFRKVFELVGGGLNFVLENNRNCHRQARHCAIRMIKGTLVKCFRKTRTGNCLVGFHRKGSTKKLNKLWGLVHPSVFNNCVGVAGTKTTGRERGRWRWNRFSHRVLTNGKHYLCLRRALIILKCKIRHEGGWLKYN